MFSPSGLDQPETSAIDIRPDCTCQDGQGIRYAFLWSPAGIPDPVGAIKLADDYGDLLSLPQRRRLNSLLHLDFSKDRTIQEAVETVLLSPRGQFAGLRPTHGRIEAWLGSGSGKRRGVDLPVIAGGSISDNFNRANETPIAAPWTELAGSTGDVNLTSNAIAHVTDGDFFLYYDNPGGWNADQSSQFLYASQVGGNHDWGPACRIGSDVGISGYFYSLYGAGPGACKLINGSFTKIENSAASVSAGITYKLDVTGTTLTYSKGGTPDANSPATDSSLTTAGNGPGVFFYESGGSIDDAVLTGEIAGGGGGGGAKNLMLLGVGGMVRLAAMSRLKDPLDRRTLAKILVTIMGGRK